MTCAITHRYEEGTDLDVHFQGLHEDWKSSGFKPSNALQLVCAIKQCFKQMLQVSCYDLFPSHLSCSFRSVLIFLAVYAQAGGAYVDHTVLDCAQVHHVKPVINLELNSFMISLLT